MQVFPDPYLEIGDAPPWLSLLILAGFLASLATLLPTQPTAAIEQAGLVLLLLAALPALEAGLGRPALGALLIGCLGLAWLVAWLTGTIPAAPQALLGATGAGLLGATLGALGRNRLRPLFIMPGGLSRWALPALVVVLAWLALQVALRLAVSDWPLLARAGCAGGGLALGWLAARLAARVREQSVLGDVTIEEGLDQAHGLIRQHDLRRARKVLAELAERFPDDPSVRELRYDAWKFHPKDSGFHAAAAALLNRTEGDADTHQYVERYYKDYLAVTQGQPRLPIGLHLDLGERFARAGDLNQAANIINPYLQRESKHSQLPRALLTLADAYVLAHDRERAIRSAESVSVMFPGTPESKQARKLLGQLKGLAG